MNFKPDIDFAPLIADGVMSNEALRILFGREPTKTDIDWAMASFRSRHPELASLVRSGAGRLYLMGERQAVAFSRVQIGRYASCFNTAVDRHEHVPVAKLTEQERREHRVACDVLAQVRFKENPLRKALPSGKER